MRPLRFRPWILFGVSAIMAASVPGCTEGYNLRVSGTVKSAAGGAPLGGVRVTLVLDGPLQEVSPVVTGADGRFEFPLASATSRHCTVKLAASGYEDEEVALSAGDAGDSPAMYCIVVSASLRPGEPSAIQALKRIGGKIRWAGTGPGDPVVGITLAGNEVTDLSLTSLKEVPTLRDLTIEGPNLTDTLLAHLGALSALQTLELVGTDHVTDGGIENLRRALPRLKITRR